MREGLNLFNLQGDLLPEVEPHLCRTFLVDGYLLSQVEDGREGEEEEGTVGGAVTGDKVGSVLKVLLHGLLFASTVGGETVEEEDDLLLFQRVPFPEDIDTLGSLLNLVVHCHLPKKPFSKYTRKQPSNPTEKNKWRVLFYCFLVGPSSSSLDIGVSSSWKSSGEKKLLHPFVPDPLLW